MAQSNAEIKKIIYASLAKQTLGRALAQLALLTKGTPNETLLAIQENYQRLLTHWVSGGKDPNREVIFNQLLRQTYEVTDDIFAARMVRPMATHPTFKQYWEPKRYEAALVQEVMRENKTGSMLQTAWIVSAITLNCLELFDENKLICLFHLCENKHPQTAMRALTGLLLCLLMYKDRYHLYPSINNRLQILFDDEELVCHAQNIIKQLIRSKETEKITQDIQQNVLPTITKLAPQIHRDLSDEKNFDTDHFEDESHNWQDMLEESGIQSKIEGYAKMQREGSDINLSTFAQMKGYPFFSHFENWLLPFDKHHEALQDLWKLPGGVLDTMADAEHKEENFLDASNNADTNTADAASTGESGSETAKDGLGTLLQFTHFLCDSDKYSFCFNLMLIPSEYRKSLIEQIKLGDEQIADVEKPSAQIICNLYLQDLYRFYTLCKNKDFFTNPFDMDMMVHEASFFRLLNPDGSFTNKLADFFFTKELYAQALSAYQKTDDHSKPNALTYRKTGYCYQKLGQYEQAIEAYQKAELMQEQDTWTLRKLAYCFRMQGKYQEALTYYLQVDEQIPNDLNVIFNIGNCHTQLGNYEDALNAFYKIEFLQGDMSKSIYYHLYMAHCLWAIGDKQKAIEHYALFPHDELAEQLEKATIPLSARDKVYIVDYLRYLTNIRN